MFDVFYFGSKPNLFEFEEYAESIDAAAAKAKTGFFWYIYGGNSYEDFDFTWRPAPWENDHVHVFPSQHQRNGEVYLAHVNSVAQRQWHYRTEQTVKRKYNKANWTLPYYITDTIDYTWHPDPDSPPYIYHFPSQHQSACGVMYKVPGATEVKLSDTFVFTATDTAAHWEVPEEINQDTIDLSWHPNVLDPAYIYHFGSDYQQSVGLTYTVPGATEIKFAGPVPTKGYHKLTVMEVLDIFFVDRGNPTAQVRFDRLNELHHVTKIRYANSMIDTIRRCTARAKTNKFWVISSEYDYTSFDFRWHAAPWQSYMTHVFPSQHNKWSDTFLINKWEFERNSQWANGLEEFPNLNFVTDQSVVKPENIHDMYYVDHGNSESTIQYEAMKLQFPDLVKTRFANTYLDTFKRIMQNANTEYVWILNSICDYKEFDFTWQPEPWQKEMIHCFVNSVAYNNRELRGDTFYIHVESFKKQMIELELLDWFNVINYVVSQKVERYPVPAVLYTGDNLIEEIKKHDFTTPFVLFTKNKTFRGMTNDTTCMWTEKDRVARDFSQDRSTTVVPRDIKKYIKTQVYDYPYLLKSEEGGVSNVYLSQPLDIVYISNGEPDAERWYNHLETVVYGNPLRAPGTINRIKRVQNVNGRVAAYQAAAQASTTDWFFAVFAKLEVDYGFDFDWQPDYWQGPKHYIFNARNPVNGLEYGHMGMIAYNKRLVLENNSPGIDFTLSQPHESVPVLSGTAHFNQDAWTTWRTAFRETLKLRLFMDTQPTLETEYRLKTWLTKGEGAYSGYSIAGAADAVAYYEEVQGDPVQLQLSFEWEWLRNRYNAKY